MGPFTRQDLRDLVIALVAAGGVSLLLMRLMGDTWSFSTALTPAAVVFVIGGVSRISPTASRGLGGWAEQRRVWKSLQAERVPDGIDRDAWVAALAELPNTDLYRRRSTWVLTARGLAALTSLGAVSAAFASDGEVPAFVRPVLASTVGLSVAIGLLRVIPWYPDDPAAKQLKTLREAP